MAWSYDPTTFHSQIGEFQKFLEHAKSDQPAGMADIFSRPFQAPSQPPITLQPQPAPEPNYYLLQTAHLYEAGLLDHEQANVIVNNIYG